MPARGGRRRFGKVRQRASGRWQARYVGGDQDAFPVDAEPGERPSRVLVAGEARKIKSGEWLTGPGSGQVASDLGRRPLERVTGIEPAPSGRKNEDHDRLGPGGPPQGQEVHDRTCPLVTARGTGYWRVVGTVTCALRDHVAYAQSPALAGAQQRKRLAKSRTVFRPRPSLD